MLALGVPRSGQATRHHIEETAFALFYRKGYARVSVDDIAARAGVTKRTLYYHFRSKDDLLAAVLEHHGGLAIKRLRIFLDRLPMKVGSLCDSYFDQLEQWA